MHPSRSFTMAACAIAALCAAPSMLCAQFHPDVSVGARVRVWLPEAQRQGGDGPEHRQLLRGSVASMATDTLRISIPRTEGTVAVPRSSVRRLEVSHGVSRPVSAAERAIGGAVGGAILWALMNDPRRSGGPSYRADWRAAGVGASWGAGIGAVVGFIIPHERWHRVRLRR